jgi:hypothetical protein
MHVKLMLLRRVLRNLSQSLREGSPVKRAACQYGVRNTSTCHCASFRTDRRPVARSTQQGCATALEIDERAQIRVHQQISEIKNVCYSV